MFELIGILTESNVPSFFEHNMRFSYVIPLGYVFKLIGFSTKGRPKISHFCFILNKNTYFLVNAYIILIITSGLTIKIRSTVLKRTFFKVCK